MCPANICTSSVKLMYTAGKISTCPHWKITCPVGHVTTKVYVHWDKIYMPWARLNVEPWLWKQQCATTRRRPFEGWISTTYITFNPVTNEPYHPTIIKHVWCHISGWASINIHHRGWATFFYTSHFTGSGKGFLPVQQQVITWTNDEVLSIGPFRNEVFKFMLKCNWWPFIQVLISW